MLDKINKIFIKRVMILWAIQVSVFGQSFDLVENGERIVDYSKYGEFIKVGENGFHYKIEDLTGLIKACGTGVYPDEESVWRSSSLKTYLEENELDGAVWNYLGDGDNETAFYKWSTCSEEPGVKQFFIAHILHKSGHLIQALKAYHSVIVHFSRSTCWSEDGTFVWYVAQAALDEIINICRLNPMLELELTGAYVDVINGGDIDLGNDVVIVNPGKFQRKRKKKLNQAIEVVEQRGYGKVVLKKYSSGEWQMYVNNEPFFIRGVTYAPTSIGQKASSGFENYFNSWMWTDSNGNGKIDTAYDAWIDANRNNLKDSDEQSVGDFFIMNQMGINAIRIYSSGSRTGYKNGEFNKNLLRQMYREYGIMVIMGDFLGAYTIGSGAEWEKGTDYTDKNQREKMKASVMRMVQEHKDEPYVLFWLLGNENDMNGDYSGVNASRTNAGKYPEAYLSLLEEIANMIHEIDPNHPVGVGNMSFNYLHLFQQNAPSLDIFGINNYALNGFGALWTRVKRNFDRPVFLPEFGCDAYFDGQGERDDLQLEVLKNCWEDISHNRAGGEGTGNSIGGCFFEYLDEWWKDTHSGDSPFSHQIEAQFRFNTFDGWSHEEWLGIFGQGNGEDSPFLREPRKIYYFLKEME